ncbi:MAG TPA: nuclear transport factor 2 family protein [Vicinamibacterales bacterium]|nr:nuclear transport factor 2 family protein [Vicinamibacterales bacterium]
MLKTTLVVLAALSMHAVAAKAQSAPAESVKTELAALMADLNKAFLAKDRAALERIYADEFLFIHALGGPVDKKGQIDAMMASTGSAGLPVTSSFDGLIVSGETAILRRPVEGRFGTTIYIKRAGRWQILQLQGTPIPTTRPTVDVSPDVLRSYAGRYKQDNGLIVNISVEGAELVLQVEGRQKLTLTADSETRFTLPAAAGQITFKAGNGGTMSYELVRGNGTVIKGTRQQ